MKHKFIAMVLAAALSVTSVVMPRLNIRAAEEVMQTEGEDSAVSEEGTEETGGEMSDVSFDENSGTAESDSESTEGTLEQEEVLSSTTEENSSEEGSSEENSEEGSSEESSSEVSTDDSSVEITSVSSKETTASAEEETTEPVTESSTESLTEVTTEDATEAETEEQEEERPEEVPFDATQNVGSMSVTVQAPEGVFPKGAYFTVTSVSADGAVDKTRSDDKTVAKQYAFDIVIHDQDGNEIEPDTSKGNVKVTFRNSLIRNDQLNCDVYHVPDGFDTAERLSCSQSGDTVTVNTDSFSVYVVEFTYDSMSYTMQGSSAVKLSEILNAVGLSGTVENAKSSNTSLFEAYQQNGTWMVKAKKAFDSKETLTVVLDGISYEISVTDDNTDAENVYIRSLSTQLFSGAAKDTDGTYVWNASDSISGHRFSYRISFALSGVDTAEAKSVRLTIPKSILTDRDGNAADSAEFSIPSKADVDAATDKDGNINSGEISSDVSYAYYADGDSYVIYNFRDISAAENSYIELSYTTTKSTFNYVDNASQHDFTCSMTVGNGTGSDQTKSADPIALKINTGASLDSVTANVVGTRVKTWNDDWGTDVKPETPDNYYYLVWRVHSYISATQPYDLSIDDSVVGNHDGMTVLGYRFAGQSTYSADNTVKKETRTKDRYDYVLTAISLDAYKDQTLWTAEDTAKVTVTPSDLVDNAMDSSATATWEWTLPTFAHPNGQINVFKIGDDAYRKFGKVQYYNNDPFYGTQHKANTLGFSSDDYSRYDLEEFDGYKDTDKSMTEYGPFDFASWFVGYPYEWTNDTENVDPDKPWEAYGKENVRMELIDDGVFLANTESALLSGNASSERTIENGSLDSAHTIKLTADDFRITKLQYAWYMKDAAYDAEETGEWIQKAPTYTDDDILTFYGKFGGSDDWVQIGTYNIKTGTASPVSDYVKSMTGSEIIPADGVSMTAYKISAENAHYCTELYSVPYLTLKNSDAVMKLMDGQEHLVLLNNNECNVYAQNAGQAEDSADRWSKMFNSVSSAVDYAIASQKDSRLDKSIVSTSNNVKHKYYTITWKLSEKETMLSGTGKESLINQKGGVFYDLLPAGSIPVKSSVSVQNEDLTIPSNAYTVKSIENYRGSGRTMFVVQIKADGTQYNVTFDTRHSWNSIKDYGTDVYNPAAYETGNSTITKGYPDNGGTAKADGTKTTSPLSADVSLMSGLSTNTGVSNEAVTGNRFIYSQKTWNINALTAASAGLAKKVKNDTDMSYSDSTLVLTGKVYSYELRYMNSTTSSAKDLIFYDSLENYDRDTLTDGGNDSEWHGIVTGIDVSQMTKAGCDPVIYISTKSGVDPEKDNDLSDTAVWTKVTEGTDFSSAKAVAIDAEKSTDGGTFTLQSGASLMAHIFMKAPDNAPDPKSGSYPCAYNNVYMKNTVLSEDDPGNGSSMLIHQDYTTAALAVAGDFELLKTGADTGYPISGVSFRLTGTSDYGTDVDKTAVTDYTGILCFENLERGTYTLQETKSTDNYLLDPTEHKVIIDKTGKVTFDGTDVTGKQAEITNEPRIHADVKLVKVDSVFTTTKIGGALYSLSGTSDYGTAVLETASSQPKTLDDGSDNIEAGYLTFYNIEKGKYTLKEVQAPDGYALNPNTYTVRIDENGTAEVQSDVERTVKTGRVLSQGATKYSHTSNISDDGTQNGNYGGNWTSANITGTDRGDTSKAHVVTIPGATKLHVKIVFGGESPTFDWVCMWAGSHPNYTANDYASSVTGKLGGGSHTSSSNTKEYDIDGDTVTFAFRSNSSGYYDGYGYYAVITSGPVMETKSTYAIETDAEGRYILTDEPLHEIVLTKKSSYDNSVLGNAELTLTGTSDTETTVNQTAVSDADTGTVRFSNLEAGTYLLQETKAPDGYVQDTGKYVVKLNTDGTYTISGLTKTGAVYDFYNKKKADKPIVITKVWNDGVKTHEPGELAIMLGTEVPEASTRTYQITFDANGGSFGSTTENTLSYNAKNEITSGRYAEPAPTDAEHYYFVGWSASSDATAVDSTITTAPNDITNTYLNERPADSTLTLYAVYQERPYVYYAVSPYGIGKETLKEGTAGITFGPAMGNMFSGYTDSKFASNKYAPMINAHAVSASTYLINDFSVSDGTATASESYSFTDITYKRTVTINAGATLAKGQTTVTPTQVQADMDAVQPESEDAITTSVAGGRNVIVGDDAGTDSAGNAYRCIHYDNWATILYWNEHDPHVYDKCIVNHCSKRLVLRVSNTYLTWNQKTLAPTGDGDSYLGESQWDLQDSNQRDADSNAYSASMIRAELVGTDKYTSEDATTAGKDAQTKYTESNCVFMALPSVIRNHVGAKALYDTQYDTKKYSQYGTNVDGSSGPYYDKLWLFDYNEMAKSSDTIGSSVYTERVANASAGAFNSLGDWWLRSLDFSTESALDVSGTGNSNRYGISSAWRMWTKYVAPGFVLKR